MQVLRMTLFSGLNRYVSLLSRDLHSYLVTCGSKYRLQGVQRGFRTMFSRFLFLQLYTYSIITNSSGADKVARQLVTYKIFFPHA